MALFGTFDRAGVQDANSALARPTAPQNIPQGEIHTPRQASFDSISQNAQNIDALLGSASKLVQDYQDKQNQEDQLNGQLAYAQGKTYEDVAKTGSDYSIAGYQGMQVITAMNDWSAQVQKQIQDNPGQDPQEFREQFLMPTFKKMSDSIGNNSPYAQQLLAAHAQEMFPKLAAAQVTANTQYVKQKNVDGYTDLLFSSSRTPDPTAKAEDIDKPTAQLVSLLDPNTPKAIGLNDDDKRAAITKAMRMELMSGSNRIFQALGGSAKTYLDAVYSSANLPPGLLAAQTMVESGARDFNADGTPVTSAKGGKYRLQVTDATARDPGFGIAPARDDSPAEYNRVGSQYMTALMGRYQSVPMALLAYNAGPATVDAAIAENGDPQKGETSVGDFLQKFPYQESRDYVTKVMSAMQDTSATDTMIQRNATLDSMAKQGYTPEQIGSILQAVDQYNNKQASEFSAQREFTTMQLVDGVKNDGNIFGTIEQIAAAKKINGYDDKWAEYTSRLAYQAYGTYQKQQQQQQYISGMLDAGRVNELDGKNKQLALDMQRSRIFGQVQAQPVQQSDDPDAPTPPDKSQVADQKYTQWLIDNQIVDDKMGKVITSSLTGKITDSDGSIKPEALRAYQQYETLRQNSTSGFAGKFIKDPQVEQLLSFAETYDAGDQSSGEALKSAQNRIERAKTDPNAPLPDLNNEAITRLVKNTVDNLDPGFFSMFSRNQALGMTDVYDEEIAQAKNDPRLKARLVDMTKNLMLRDPAYGQNPEAALNTARNRLAGSFELAGGNVLFGTPQQSVRQMMGLQGDSRTNAVGEAVMLYLHDKGPSYWGSHIFGSNNGQSDQVENTNFNRSQFFGSNTDPSASLVEQAVTGVKGIPKSVTQSIADIYRGVPAFTASVDPVTKELVVDLYANKERTLFLGQPKRIPLAEIGAYQIANRSRVDYNAPQDIPLGYYAP